MKTVNLDNLGISIGEQKLSLTFEEAKELHRVLGEKLGLDKPTVQFITGPERDPFIHRPIPLRTPVIDKLNWRYGDIISQAERLDSLHPSRPAYESTFRAAETTS